MRDIQKEVVYSELRVKLALPKQNWRQGIVCAGDGNGFK